ncbi:MAG: DUF166 family protein [Candidatus Bathyarchaeia archaeon]
MRLLAFYNDEFAERVAGNLINASNYCKSCGLTCTYCRQLYGSFAADVQGVYKSPSNLPAFIEEPEKFLPKNPPNCDIILNVGLHPDILAATPTLAERTGAKAVIVPLENRNWCPRGLRRQLEGSLSEIGVECAFPKPFCSLEETGKPVVDSFIRRYRVGKPVVEVKTGRGRVTDVQVVRSAPCGSTWYVAQQIKWTRISNLEDAVAVAHHSFPCTASMDVDPEIGDPILHVAGYAIRKAVKQAVEKSLKGEDER